MISKLCLGALLAVSALFCSSQNIDGKILDPFGNISVGKWTGNAWGSGTIKTKLLSNQTGKFAEFVEIDAKNARGTLANLSLFKKMHQTIRKHPVTDFYMWYRCRDFDGKITRKTAFTDDSGKTYDYSYQLGLKNDGKWHLLMLGRKGWSRHRRPLNMNKFTGISFVLKGTGKFDIGEWGCVYQYKSRRDALRSPEKLIKAVYDDNCKVVIDGKIDKKEWANAGIIKKLEYSHKQTGIKNNTTVFIKAGHDGLYFAAKCLKNDMAKLKASYKENSVLVWQDESIEFSIDPNRTTKSFKKITVNANGAFGGIFKSAGKVGIKASSKKYEDRWETEVFIPWNFLEFKQTEPFVCGFNVTRNCYDDGKLERSGWATTIWDAIDKFGVAVFGKDTSHPAKSGNDKFEFGRIKIGEYIVVGNYNSVPANYRLSIFAPNEDEVKFEGKINRNKSIIPIKLASVLSGKYHISLLTWRPSGEISFLESDIVESPYSSLKSLDVNAIALFPIPRIFEKKNGFVSLSSNTSVYMKNQDLAFCLKKLDSELKDFYNIKLKKTDNINKSNIIIGLSSEIEIKKILTAYKLDSNFKKIKYDGFSLYVSDNKIIIAANEKRGVLYGINSFLDLVKMSSGDIGQPKICKVTIFDWPRHKIRFSHMVIHSFYHGTKYEANFFNEMLDRFQMRFRFNGYLFELADYYKWKSVPIGNKNAWDEKDYIKVVDFINQNYMPVMPSIQSHGHMAWWLFRIKGKLVQFREDGHNDVLCTGHPDAYKMLFSIYDENWKICSRNPEYRPKYFFTSMDEVRWKTSSIPLEKRCKYCKGIPKNKIYLEHIKKLNSYINKKDAKMMMCSDMVAEDHNGLNEFKCAEIVDQIPKNIVMCHWSKLDFPSIGKFKKLGFENWKFLTAYKESAMFESMITGYCFNNCSYNWWLSLNRCKANSLYGNMAQALFVNNAWNDLPEDGSKVWRKYTKIYGTQMMRNWSRKPLIHAGQKITPIDLSSAVNRVAIGEKGWFLQGKQYDLSSMDFAADKIADIPVKFAKINDKPGCLVLNKTSPLSTNIKLNRKAASFILLHAAHLPKKYNKSFFNRKYYGDPLKGKTIVRYKVKYSDGSSTEFPVNYGWNVSEWLINPESMREIFSKYVTDARYIWEGKTLHAKTKNLDNDIIIYQYEWVNPFPGKNIDSIKLESTDKYISYALLAISSRESKNK